MKIAKGWNKNNDPKTLHPDSWIAINMNWPLDNLLFGCYTEGVIGDEDCLYLDVTVPSNTRPGDNKSVMVFIHGGGFSIGSRSIYIGGGLATTGDVVVVSINYRLGLLGLMFDESGMYFMCVMSS